MWGLGTEAFNADHTISGVTYTSNGYIPTNDTLGTWEQSGDTYKFTYSKFTPPHVWKVRLSADCEQLIGQDQDGVTLLFPFYRMHPPATPTVANGTNKPGEGLATSTNSAQYCPDECKLRNAIWNGKDEYPRCNCVCQKGYDFDSNGMNCVPITSQSGTSGESSGHESELLLDLEPQGTIKTIKAGDEINVPPNGDAKLLLKCKNLQNQMLILEMIIDSGGGLPIVYNLGTYMDHLQSQLKSMKVKCAELGAPLEIMGVTRNESKLRTLSADASGMPISATSCIELAGAANARSTTRSSSRSSGE